jgi:hypothetical protein
MGDGEVTTVLVLGLLVTGLAMIVGATGFAKKAAYATLAAVLVVAIMGCLLCELQSRWSGTANGSADGSWFWFLLVVALIGVGWLAWKTRSFRQNRLADRRRRDMHPRQPAPPPQPLGHDTHGGGLQ